MSIHVTTPDWLLFKVQSVCMSVTAFSKSNNSTVILLQVSLKEDSQWNHLLSPVENGGASRWKMAARGIEGFSGLAPGEPGIGIG
jgi:hypothetical protein